MRLKYILTFGLIITLTACGENSEKQKMVQNELAQREQAKQNELKRIHLEKIEVGKDIQRRNLKNELEQLNGKLEKAKNDLKEIEEFQIGRSSSTKEKQVENKKSEIKLMEEYIANIEKEIPLINLHQTFDFQKNS